MAMRRRFMQDSRIDVNRYLTFVARENNTSVSLINTNLNTYGFSDIQYSINGEHLIKGNVDNIIINSGETLSVKATYHAPLFITSAVVISKPVDVIGTISSIFASANNYRCIFCRTSIVDASLLSLPATTLTDECYDSMFSGCSSLTAAPELPATTLANYCYSDMFNGCTSLTTAPALPATTLASSCYSNMFNGCTSLTTAPELPATTLKVSCYSHMFRGCSKLNHIKMLATNISASNCLTNWVQNVSSTGTFVKHPNMTSLPTGISGIPSGWTVINNS